jgi:alpha-glucosidase (family GH31 glycosyl hydrolase)
MKIIFLLKGECMSKNLLKICFGIIALTGTVFAWTAGNLTVDVVNSPMDIKVSAGTKTLLEVTGIAFGATNYTAIASVNSMTDSMVLTLGANQSLTISSVPTGGLRMYGTSPAAATVKITMKDQNDHFYGIREHNCSSGTSPDIRGISITLSPRGDCNTMGVNALAYSAFFMSSLGYGCFFDSFAEGTYALGVGGQSTITHSTTAIDWYIFYGPTGDKIHHQYFKVIGAPKKVVIWGCGPVIWHNNYSGSAQVLSHNTNYIANQIPITAQWIDRPFSDGAQGWGYMNFSAAFANPATWLKQITADTGYNVKLMTWTMPGTFGTPVPPAGTYFNGGNYYLDLSNPAAVTWYEHQLDSLQHSIGVQGHKMDRCDGDANPFPTTWSDGTPGPQQKWKYLYLNAKVTDAALRTLWGDNQFNFPRGAYHRCQPYISAIWSGDIDPPWAGLVETLSNALKAAFMGFPMWGSDIGGYMNGATKIPTDQYLRWLTFGCFSGLMENMLDGKEPYTYTAAGDAVDGQTFVARYKSIADLRMSLVPYVYSLVNTSADNGVAMRPLPYMYPDDANTYQIPDEYLFGNAFLVAPIVSASMTRSVYLPGGSSTTWYYFFNQTETHTAGTFTTPSIPLYQIPVYIKSNSVYVTGQIYPGNSKRWITNYDATRNVVINAFPGVAGETDTFTYVDYLASDAKKVITLEASSGGVVHIKSPAMTVYGTLKVLMAVPTTNVKLNNFTLTAPYGYSYSDSGHTLMVPFASNEAVDLWINGAVGALPSFEKHSLLGRLQVRMAGNAFKLLVPPVTGLSDNSRIEAGILDMQGRLVWKGTLAASQICSSTYAVPLYAISKGSYIATVKVDGVIVQRSKIVVP